MMTATFLPLPPAARAEVRERLPPSVRAGREASTTCAACRRVDWPGSPEKRMLATPGGAIGLESFP